MSLEVLNLVMRNRKPKSVQFLLVVLVCGCNASDRLETYPVTGKVFQGGQPAVGATVLFHRSDVSKKTDAFLALPKGVVTEDGTYFLTSFEHRDGAPEGKYRVTVSWPQELSDSYDPEEQGMAPDRLNGRYDNPSESTIEREVSANNNELLPIELK